MNILELKLNCEIYLLSFLYFIFIDTFDVSQIDTNFLYFVKKFLNAVNLKIKREV